MTPTRQFWVITIACSALILLGVSLGAWQLRRADFKKDLRLAQEASLSQPSLTNDMLGGRKPSLVDLHRRIEVTGKWLPDETLFWDNIPMSGKTGFVVLTPFQLAASSQIVLVQRGWVLRNFMDRTALPDVNTPTGVIRLQGIVSTFPSQRIALGGGEFGRIRQNPSIESYQAKFGNEFATVSIRQTGTPDDGLLREWAQVDDGVSKHMGYAFQWFSLSALVLVYYVWFQIVKRKQSEHRP